MKGAIVEVVTITIVRINSMITIGIIHHALFFHAKPKKSLSRFPKCLSLPHNIYLLLGLSPRT